MEKIYFFIFIILNANNIYSIEYCAAYVEKDDKYVLKSDYDKLKQDNDELKAKMAALESKLNGISLSNDYTKSKCDNQYAVKPPTYPFDEEREYKKTIDDLYMIEGHYGENIVINGQYQSTSSFNVNQIISGEHQRVNGGNSNYLTTNASEDEKYIINNIYMNDIYYCGVRVEKEDKYKTKSFADETYRKYSDY